MYVLFAYIWKLSSLCYATLGFTLACLACVCVRVCVCVCVCASVYVHIHTYVHTSLTTWLKIIKICLHTHNEQFYLGLQLILLSPVNCFFRAWGSLHSEFKWWSPSSAASSSFYSNSNDHNIINIPVNNNI